MSLEPAKTLLVKCPACGAVTKVSGIPESKETIRCPKCKQAVPLASAKPAFDPDATFGIRMPMADVRAATTARVAEAVGNYIGNSKGARRENSLRQAGRHMADALDAGADCVVTPCPLCHLNLDLQQPEARPFVERDLGMPVLHLPQLIGLALGLDIKELGLHRHVVKTDPVQEKVAALTAAA